MQHIRAWAMRTGPKFEIPAEFVDGTAIEGGTVTVRFVSMPAETMARVAPTPTSPDTASWDSRWPGVAYTVVGGGGPCPDSTNLSR